jgi:hypothetical protein
MLMGLLSLADVAIYRDQTRGGQPIIARAKVDSRQPVADAPTTPPDGVEGVAVASYGKLLTAQIPGEALLAYTTVLALFPDHNSNYEMGRWIVYFASIVVCVVVVIGAYLARRIDNFHDRDAKTGRSKPWQHLPYFPALTAVFARGVYGLTVPGSALQQLMNAPSFAVVAGSLAVGGGVIMSILAPFLGKGNATKVDEKSSSTESRT